MSERERLETETSNLEREINSAKEEIKEISFAIDVNEKYLKNKKLDEYSYYIGEV